MSALRACTAGTRARCSRQLTRNTGVAYPSLYHFDWSTPAIYHLLPAPAGSRVGGEGAALKVFHPPLRSPALLAQAQQLAAFAHLPGLQAARRAILTPAHHPDLLQRHPDLAFAALMPWIPGPTWQHILLAKRPLSPHQALTLARALAAALAGLEQHRLAHCALASDHLSCPPWPQMTSPGRCTPSSNSSPLSACAALTYRHP
jgi:hypothetical protein